MVLTSMSGGVGFLVLTFDKCPDIIIFIPCSSEPWPFLQCMLHFYHLQWSLSNRWPNLHHSNHCQDCWLAFYSKGMIEIQLRLYFLFFAWPLAFSAFFSTTSKTNLNCPVGHHFVLQTAESAMGSWNWLLVLSTQCFAWLWCEIGSG